MNQAMWTSVDHYFSEALIPHDAVLEEVLKANSEAGLPPHDVSLNQGMLLQLLARGIQARRILEIGTLGAYSTIWMARAMPDDGKLITLEADPKHAAVALANLKRAGVDKVVEVRIGKALDHLPQLASQIQEPFDFVFIDADKANNPNYFAWALKMSRKGTLIIVDNIVRNGAVLDPSSTDPNVQGVQRLNQLLSQEPGVSATALQSVGTKGWDGFILALVTRDR